MGERKLYAPFQGARWFRVTLLTESAIHPPANARLRGIARYPGRNRTCARGGPHGAIVMHLQRTPATQLDRRPVNRLEGQRDHVSG
jgi:hypothetical protein